MIFQNNYIFYQDNVLKKCVKITANPVNTSPIIPLNILIIIVELYVFKCTFKDINDNIQVNPPEMYSALSCNLCKIISFILNIFISDENLSRSDWVGNGHL